MTTTPTASPELPDLDRLEALARAATPGPWTWWTSNSVLRLSADDGIDGGVLHAYSRRSHADICCGESDRAFIAAANPAAVLALIALARRAKPEGEAPQAELAEGDTVKVRPGCRAGANEDFSGRVGEVVGFNAEGMTGVEVDFPDGSSLFCTAAQLEVVPAPAAQHAESGAQAGEYCDHQAFIEIMDAILTPQGMARFNADEDVNLNREFASAIFLAGLAAQSQGARAPGQQFVDAARAFAQAHLDCDEMEARDDQGDDAVSDDLYEKATDAYNRTKAALVSAYKAEAPASQQAAAPGSLPDLLPPMGIHNDRDMLNYLMVAFDNEILTCGSCGRYEPTKDMDSAGFLRDYLAAAPSAPGTPEAPQTAAARDVLAERQRQVEKEGWTPAHDDMHGDGQMAVAAGYYALASGSPYERSLGRGHMPVYWPWAPSWWKPRTRRNNLVRAGALVLAEIERLDRAAQLDGGQGDGEKA